MTNESNTLDNSAQTANNTTLPTITPPQGKLIESEITISRAKGVEFIDPLAALREQLAKFTVIFPLTEYSAALDAIADKMRVCENITEHAAEYAAEYAAAKDNYFYLEALADLEAADRKAKQATERAEAAEREAAELKAKQATERAEAAEREAAEREVAELRRRVVSQERLFATIPLAIPTPHTPKPAATPKQPAAPTLNPLITPSQIGQIHAETKGIFTATIEQWRALFAETQIVMNEPIKAATPSDITIFLYYLKEYEIINTNRYAAIVERAKAFKINNKLVTAKQLRKVKENNNFPDNVRNSDKLQQIAYAVRPRLIP